jgi:hypothetical protein
MISLRQVLRWNARLLLSAVFGLVLYGTASAGIVSTSDAINAQQATKAREQIKAMAQRPELADQLKALGVDADQAGKRVDAMTDAEVLALAGRLGDLPAGGRMSNNELVLVLVIIILVLAL